MKKRLQGLIAGLLIGAIVVGGAAYADQAVKIVIDGHELIPTDVNGNRVDPVIIDGTTYLPVRAIANAFGKTVYWDGPNYTVYLGDRNTLSTSPYNIETFTSISQTPLVSDRLTDNYGNIYSHAIISGPVGGNTNKFEYLLNKQYSRFKGKLYIPNGETSDRSRQLHIIADGKTIYTSPQMKKTSKPVNIDLNISQYNDIQIEFDDIWGNWYDLCICLGDAVFYR